MLILRPYEAKLLLPTDRRDWLPSSQRESFDPLNHGTQTRWRLTARLHDGAIAWRGWFDDRDDVDAFLYAVALGTIRQHPELWRLPTPHWEPDLYPDLRYDLATLTFLTGTPGTNATYTRPADWNNASNSIECIGPGAYGGPNGRGGGGGGSYAKIVNAAILSSVTYNVGATGGWGGNLAIAGTPSWFRIDSGTTNPTSTTQGVRGYPGACGGDPDGGPGGSTANSIGTTTYKGGDAYPYYGLGGGGGGAAGPNGAGGNSPGSTSGSGGPSGGGAAVGASANGNNGTEWDATHGSGSGGGGGNPNPGGGGNYGAGTGGQNVGATAQGAPAQGIIVVTYDPAGQHRFFMVF